MYNERNRTMTRFYNEMYRSTQVSYVSTMRGDASAAQKHLESIVAQSFRTISEAPVPEYGGAPNLCEDLY